MIKEKISNFFTRFKAFFLCVGILVGAVVLVAGMKALKPKPEEEKSQKPPLVVQTATASFQEQIVSSTFQGVVRAKTNIELVSQVTGKVTSVSNKFIEGGQFEQGETLVQIDDADYLVALRSAEANVASAQVDVDIELATAATNAREWRDLQGRPIDEANPLRLNKPQIDRARARLNAARAELAAARLNYDRTKISAPFAGRIMTKTAELGQFMSRGSSVGRVFATDAMEIRIPMTDVQIGELGVSLGYSAPAAQSEGVPATVSALFGIEQREWQGYLKNVDASVDNETRLLFATIVVEQPFAVHDGQAMPLVPGLFVDVELASPQTLKGIQIPRAALRNGTQVYVMEDSTLRLKHVDVVYTSIEHVVVSDSELTTLSSGEQVIVSSVPGAYDGMPIKLPEVIAPKETVEPELVAPDTGADTEPEAQIQTS
ncbi:MAG: RND family efflux transporter MFP subunit [Cryomorphaceae bacterium]|jgi:RND family efflux transporter MFP subunit